ncbi:MAG: acetyl-CoA C-acyltransferase [Bacteroidia bacterium]
MKKEVYIVSAVRTAIGSYNGALASLSAIKLGSIAIKAAIERAGIKAAEVQEVFFGNVLSANLGQAPARQAALGAGISNTTPCTTINKVCASGSKSVMLGVQSILLGDNDVVVAGGTESMSNVPYYLEKARFGYNLGHGQLIDGLVRDGLWDVYNNFHMGSAAEMCADECSVSREDQDEYAINSYKRTAKAWENRSFKDEVIPVEIAGRKETVTFSEDEEYRKVKFEKIPSLRPVFKKEGGTVTAANASTLNDGAAAIVLMSREKAEELGVKPLAKIISYADAAKEPERFTIAPAEAIQKALKKASLSLSDIDFFEINEAFAVVSVANNRILNLDPEKVNVFGGAVSLGHPLGASGARILVTLTSVLKQKKGKYGVIGICNGGGGASAMVIENLQ